MNGKFPWRVFWLLLFAGILGTLAGLPFALELLCSSDKTRRASPISLPVIALHAIAQNGVILVFAIAVGLRLARCVGFQLPIIMAWASGQRPVAPRPIVVDALVLSVAVGMLNAVIEAVVFRPHLPPDLRQSPVDNIPLWKPLVAGIFYGGIVEELFFRLFLFSLLAWLLGFVLRAADRRPSAAAFWTANLVVALLFASGHLPATSALAPLTPMLVTRALMLNGVAGVTCGYLFWRRGLEAAMLAHMTFHLVMQLPGALLIRMAGASTLR
jgi:membrane protease YdiL (CAAX protease family)